MKRNYFVICFIALFVMSNSHAFAQAKLKNAPKFHMGLRTALQLTNYPDAGDGSIASGNLGLAMDFRIAPIPLYLETGLYFRDKTGKDDEMDISNAYSLSMPLLLSYHLYLNKTMSLQPFLGYYIDYTLNGNEWLDDEELDHGIRIGCGWNFGRLYANLAYDFGLEKHECRDYGYYYRRYYGDESAINHFMFTIGFNFAGSK